MARFETTESKPRRFSRRALFGDSGPVWTARCLESVAIFKYLASGGPWIPRMYVRTISADRNGHSP